MTKRTKTIGEIFDEGTAIDAAVKRAVRRAVRAPASRSRKAAKPHPKRRAT